MKELGNMWNALPTASKKPYNDAASTEMAAFKAKWPEGPPKVLNIWLFRGVFLKLCAHQAHTTIISCFILSLVCSPDISYS
jgi:hypothetical protein